MLQITQNLRTGATVLEEVPVPLVKPGYVLVKTRKSMVSSGTERMLVGFGKANLLQKVIRQPERAQALLNKIKADGLASAYRAVASRLDQVVALGYCNVGEVIDVGAGVTDIQIGNRVVSNGPHAEIVCVARNLLAKIPDNVTDDEAVFTVVGAVGLQGIRLLSPALGETVVVIGLGLIGLLTAQLLMLQGCRVIGVDPDATRADLAATWGVLPCPSDPATAERVVLDITDGLGADRVIVTASARRGNIASLAAALTRSRGRIVLIGEVGMKLRRQDLYKKELTIQVSCSYGPGRYDEDYEAKGRDYPLPHVRWTANRNFQAVLEKLASRSLHVKPLITDCVPIADYGKIYQNLTTSSAITTLFTYPDHGDLKRDISLSKPVFDKNKGVVGIIGAGQYVRNTLLPLLGEYQLKYIVSENGLTGTELARKYNIAISATDFREVLADREVDLVMIATRHHQHGEMVKEALQAGKHVFVEKPLTIFENDLEEIIAYQNGSLAANTSITVGFNRRFSTHVQKMKLLLANVVMTVIVTVNAGFIEQSSWLHDPMVGGGRVLGEGCHFFDLITYLTGSRVIAVCMNTAGTNPSVMSDNATIMLRYENGSSGVINYCSNGHKAYSKERVEVHAAGQTLILDNFRSLNGYGFKGFSGMKTSQDKGHKEQFIRLLSHIRESRGPLIPFEEIINMSRATFAALESLKKGSWIHLT
jgi:predicted dehydrogenase/threonine dehydrogenase-like Zn-dependent dehydrogenase